MRRTLVVTNDFPPRSSAAARFVHELAGLLPAEQVVVYAAAHPDESAADDAYAYPVLRDPARTLLPTAKVRAGVVDAFQAYGCDRLLLGSAIPLGWLAPAVREAGAERIVALTGRAERWSARLPGSRQALRRVGELTDALTYQDDATRSAVAPALSPAAAARMVRLAPGVDPGAFRPDAGGAELRRRYGIAAEAPVVGSVLMDPAGPDLELLVSSFARLCTDLPSARLLVVGAGRRGRALAERVRSAGLTRQVVLAGPTARAQLPAWLDAADVYLSLPRSGFGGRGGDAVDLAALEAQATGVPVVVADGDARPETLAALGRLGEPVRRDPAAVAARLRDLLQDPRAAEVGAAGRAWVERSRSWADVRATLVQLLG